MENSNVTQTTAGVTPGVPRLPCCIQTVISGKEQNADIIGVKSYIFMQAS